MLIGNNTTLETSRIAFSFIQELVNVVFIKHFKLFLVFIKFDTAFILFSIASIVFIIDCWLPLLKEVADHTHIKVLFEGGFVD